MSVAVTVVQVQAMDGDGESRRVGESGRVREREDNSGEASRNKQGVP